MNSSRIWLWGFLGYLSSLVDDNPVNADTLLGPGIGFYFMELLLRSLTIACFYLAVREAAGRQTISRKTFALMIVAFVWTSGDDLRYLLGLDFIFFSPWEYPAVLTLQAVSLFFFLLAVRSANPQSGRSNQAPSSGTPTTV